MTVRRSRMPLMILALALTACSGDKADKDAASVPAENNAGSPSASTSNRWNALDACATLGTDNAAEASGSAVKSASLSSVTQGSESTAAVSTCTFELENGGRLMLLTRQAPVDDATPDAIEAARTAGGTMPAAIDVPALGAAALWSDTTKGLQVFIDGSRYFSINYFGLPGGADGKDQAIAVAEVLLGTER